MSKSSGDVQLESDISLAGATDALHITSSGRLDLNGNDCSIAGGDNIQLDGTGVKYIVNESGTESTLSLAGTFDVERSSTATLNIGSNIVVDATSGAQDYRFTTIEGTLQMSGGSFSTYYPTWGSTSVFSLNSGGSENYTTWSSAWPLYGFKVASGTSFALNTNLGGDGDLDMQDDFIVAGTVTVDAHDGCVGTGGGRGFDVAGDLNIESGGSLTLGCVIGDDLWVAGNLTNNGSFDCASRAMFVDGSSTQQLYGDWTGSSSIDYFQIQNTHASAGLELYGDMAVDFEMRWDDGYIVTKTGWLYYNTTNGGYSYGTHSHVVGDGTGGMRYENFGSWDDVRFPIGPSAGYVGAGTGVIRCYDSDGDLSSGLLSVGIDDDMTMDGADYGITNTDEYVQFYYHIDHPNVSGSSDDLYVYLYWKAASEGGSFTNTSSVMYHYYSSAWNSESTTRTVGGTWKYLEDNVTTLSPFAIGDVAPEILPVELHSFWVDQVDGQSATLAWITASEVNNDHFVIERSLDGVNFNEIGQVAGAGMSSEEAEYEFVDNTFGALDGDVYYRLRQVDFDGTEEVFNAVVIPSDPVITKMKVVPNPVIEGIATYLMLDPRVKDAQVEVLDVIGRNVWTSPGTISTAGKVVLPGLSAGTYMVRARKGDWMETQRFLVR